MTKKYSTGLIDQSENTVRFCLKKNEHYLSFAEVFELWKTDASFVKFYKEELLKLNFQAFYWEHPALKTAFLEKPYECILQRSRPLEHLSINETAFQSHLFLKEKVADFRNLGKDARLVIPTKKTDQEIYNHFGKFLRLAEEEQVIEFFQRVGKIIIEEIGQQESIWLNTAGLGVIWLHIRMDTRPKYYKTGSYKDPEFLAANS